MKKALFAIVIVMLLALTSYGQPGEKGLTVTNTSKSNTIGKTWAIIIGISEYKDIHKLNYAHKDAEAFYNYLRSPQLNVPAENIKLLLNQDASSAEIYGALDWLSESVKQNDKVIFYFSGHGDVEKKTIHQNGFLLAYDSPIAAYMTKGTISIKYLQDYLETYIGVNKAAEAILIVDACKSGKLAGGMEGMKITMQALGQEWKGQITKILSAQEGEVSLEDPKWGGGRGVFSYYLMKGIQGLANRNVDHTITTGELAAYLPIVVGDETSNNQNPKIEGDPKHALFEFDDALLANAKKDDLFKGDMLAVNKKGIIDELTPSIDSAYKKYSEYVKKGWLLWGKDEKDTLHSAVHYYNALLNHPDATSIRPTLKSSFLSALQKSSQSNLDSLLKGMRRNSSLLRAAKEITYAASIIDKNHILYNYIKARSLYYNSRVFVKDDKKAISMLKEALKLEEDAPYLYFGIAVIYDEAKKLDSALFYYQKAQEFAPTWDYPSINIGVIYLDEKLELEKAKDYFQKAIALNGKSYLGNNNLGAYYNRRKEYEKALEYYQKAVALDSTDATLYHGNIINVYSKMHKFDEAIKYAKKALALYPKSSSLYNSLGNAYKDAQNYDEAILSFQKALAIDPKYQYALASLGIIYEDLKQYDKALQYYQKAVESDPKWEGGYVNLGNIYGKIKNGPQAIANYEKAISLNPQKTYAYIKLGNYYLKQNLFNKAIATYNRELKVNPKSINALIEIGNAYSDKSQDTALTFYFKAFELDSTNIIAINNIGIVYENLKQYQKATAYFEKAISIDPKNHLGYANLGEINNRLNNYAKAIEYYKIALKFNPKDTETYQSLAILDSLNQLYYYNKILSYDKNNEYAYHFAGHAYLADQPIKGFAYFIKAVVLDGTSDSNNDIERALENNSPFILPAIKFYEDSLAIDKKEEMSKINYMKGYLLYNEQKYQEALPYFQKAIAIDPAVTNTYNLAGITAMYLNNKPLTISYFAKMIVLDPKNPNSNYNLACFYSLNKDIPNSIKNLKSSLDKGYKNYPHIMEDTDLINLRKSVEFKALMKKYFPNNR